ncbi:uncharacterized protein LOC144514138 [Sander vitreus]
MNWRTIQWFGFIFIIVLIIMAATTENVKLICSESLDAAVGDDVTLDFYFEPPSDVTKSKGFVFECKQNSDHVLVYKSGGFSVEDQAKRFHGRVSPDSSWELSKGKLAWKISQFGESDAGTYRCIVQTKQYQLSSSTELKIKQLDVPKKQSKAYHPTDVTVTLVLAMLVLLL